MDIFIDKGVGGKGGWEGVLFISCVCVFVGVVWFSVIVNVFCLLVVW